MLSRVLELDSESPDGETLAGALIRLVAKMQNLGYPLPETKRRSWRRQARFADVVLT